jgi:large subunit ribosomal protein L15
MMMSTAAATSPALALEPITFLKLNNLHDNPGAVKRKRRKGRGIGSGRGKTCGRGHKGQKSRSGGSIPLLFEGGQNPLWKRIPKRGFKNKVFATPMTAMNIGNIQMNIDMKRLDPTKKIDLPAMKQARMIKPSGVKHGVKLLSKGKELLKQPLHIEVNRASAAAIAAIEDAGGTVTTIHLNKLALRVVMRPEKYEGKLVPKRARPKPKMQPYYTSYNKRGYLHPAIQLRKWFTDRHPEMEGKFNKMLEITTKAVQQEQEQNLATATASASS